MSIKKIEKISTASGVILLVLLAVLGVFGCLDIAFNVNFFASEQAENVVMLIALLTCVLIFCCFLVSTMLNVSRMANSMERSVEMLSNPAQVSAEAINWGLFFMAHNLMKNAPRVPDDDKV